MATDEYLQKPHPMVNYTLLTSVENPFANRVVTILGRLNEASVDTLGTNVTIETSDHQSLVLRMASPVAEILPNYVEFIGRVGKNGREVECLHYSPIKDEVSEGFDFDQYNRMVEMTAKYLALTETMMA